MTSLKKTLVTLVNTLSERDKVQAALSLTVTLAVVVLFITRDSVPDTLLSVWTLIIGFYFGTRVSSNGSQPKGG